MGDGGRPAPAGAASPQTAQCAAGQQRPRPHAPPCPPPPAAAAASAASAAAANGAPPPAAPRPSADLPKNFDPAEAEDRLYAFWEASGAFAPAPAGPKAPYTLPMPPPNVTGKLHMGHAMFVTLQDIMARYRRMAGHPTLWLPGTDHAGIATQSVVEKQLEAAGGSRGAMGRDAFVARVWDWKRE
jgi:valyl-tRNA synthetase